MRKSSIVCGIVALALLSASVLLAEDQAKRMTNDDVVSMLKAGLPEDIIIGSMNEQATNFDVSASALVNLKKEGVSVKVMQAMLTASNKHHDSGASAPPSPGTDKNATPQPSGDSAPPAQTDQSSPAESTAQQPGARPAAHDANPASSSSFFDRMNQIQNQVSGAITQAQGTAQQLRGTAQHAKGTAQPGQGTTLPNLAAPAAAAPTASPAASVQAGAQAQAVERQQQMAANQAALQQQRQQQVAARQAAAQQRSQRVAACAKQYMQARPTAKTQAQAEAITKSYAACLQAASQAK